VRSSLDLPEHDPGCSRFESLIFSHHSRYTCECNKEDINDDEDE